MSLKERFEIPPGFRKWSLGLMGIGVLSLIVGYFVYGTGDEAHQTRFWGVLLHNSIYFLLVVNAAMFFFCATTLALAGFQVSFRRVTEAISACVPVIGGITFVVMLCIVFGHKSMIYEWLDKAAVAKDAALNGKKGFLNPGFFITWTILTIGLWSMLGYKMRSISREIGRPSAECGGRKEISFSRIPSGLRCSLSGLRSPLHLSFPGSG